MSAQDSAKTVDILEMLKSAILNIDWEISDENIGILNKEISALRAVWQGQKIYMIYLQILGALSQYIATTKEQGNPGAFPMLRAVFDSLEDLVVNPTDDEQQTKKVMEHVEAYNELKNAVATGKTKYAPAPEPEPEKVPEPEVAAIQAEVVEKEQPSTINRLLNDQEDHSTDSIFDSMLDEMVQAEPPDQVEEPAQPSPPPQSRPAPPPVQAAYNKDEGTEIEADRNIEDEFSEADELLDNFFEDDVPAPGAFAKKADKEFDLSALDEDSDDVLDLDQTAREEIETGAGEDRLELSLEDDAHAEEAPGLESGDGQIAVELDYVEDSELDIFKVDDEPAKKEIVGTEAADFPEMESALDDFFAPGEEEIAAPQMAAASLEESGPGEGVDEVDFALDDLFGEEEPEAAGPEVEEALDLEIPPKSAEAVPAPPAESGPAAAVAGLKKLLLSVEWEVDDQLLERVDAEISTLSEKLAANNVALIHLNFLNTVIHHIGREQSQVISESMACLKMITESLEDLLASEGGVETTYASKAVASFIDWHELVVAEFEKRLDAVKRQEGDLAESIEELELPSAEGESAETQKLKQEILSEVREILSREMQAMRQELSVKD